MTSKHINVKKEFIEKEMPFAPPVYVCVYLMTEAYPTAPAKEIADRMNMLESDVLKAWKYWDERDLFTKPEVANIPSLMNQNKPRIKEIKINQPTNQLKLEFDTDAIPEQKKEIAKKTETTASQPIRVVALEQKPTYTPEELNHYMQHDALKCLIDDVHRIIAKPLSHQDIATIFSFYDWLGLPIEVIGMLFTYCSENGFKGMRYIETVALSWADLNIRTVEAAKNHIGIRKNGHQGIMKAFGLHRTPIPAEEEFIKKWLISMELPLAVVQRACEKTVLSTGNVSFPYTDSILADWKKRGVKEVKDIEAVDRSYQKKKSATKTKATPQRQATQKKPDKFVNFAQREWDFDALEKLQKQERNKW